MRGDVNSEDEFITGGDYADTSTSFGTTWRSPDPAVTLTSANALVKKVNFKHGIDINWQYKVPSGTNSWITATALGDMTNYVIYNAPVMTTISGAGGALGNADFTAAHLESALDRAQGASADVTPSSIAAEMVSDRGAISVVDEITHSNVTEAWNAWDTGEHGACCCFASGLAYALACIGVDGNVGFANLDTAINTTGVGSGVAECRLHSPIHVYDYVGYRTVLGVPVGNGNYFQGHVYLTGAGASTVCYDCQHGFVRYYWELGNDQRGGVYQGASGNGVLYNYCWAGGPNGGQIGGQQQTTAPAGTCGHTLVVVKSPQLAGN